MNCHETRRRLELLALDALAGAEAGEVRAHLARCRSCRLAAREYRQLVAAIEAGVDAPTPSAAFRRTLGAAVGSEIETERRRPRARRVLVATGSLAALLLLALGAWRALRPEDRRPSPAGATPQFAQRTSFRLPEKWRYAGVQSGPASVAESVVVHGSSMYLIAGDGAARRVVAVDTATGEARWTSKTESLGYLSADASRVFCLAKGRRGTVDLLALDAADGRALWRRSCDARDHAPLPCRPAPLPGGRVCWTVGREVRALDGATGDDVWRRSFTDEGLPSRAAATGQAVYVATARGLTCLDAGTGRRLWRRQCRAGRGWAGRPLLALAEGRAYVAPAAAGRGSSLCCVDTVSRQLVWCRDVPRIRSLLATPSGVYLRAGNVVALNGQTGDLLWTRPAEGCGPLSVVDGAIHFADARQNGRLVALEPDTGRLAREIPGIRSCGAFTRVGDTGFIKTRDGIVHAVAMAAAGRS